VVLEKETRSKTESAKLAESKLASTTNKPVAWSRERSAPSKLEYDSVPEISFMSGAWTPLSSARGEQRLLFSRPEVMAVTGSVAVGIGPP
jgi:hypothetical protein